MTTISRYDKQLILSEFGETSQNKIKNAKVLIIGIGGIGNPVLMYLSSMGFENIGIIEYDTIEVSNLHRQVIYKESDIGLSKISCAVNFCQERNSNVKIKIYSLKITNSIALTIISQYDIIIDCTDNIFTRYIINDACVLLKKPYFFGSAIETSGQVGVFNYKNSPCLRCIYPQNNMPTCESTGVLGIIPSIIGNLLALEVVKFVCNFDGLLSSKLLNFDLFHGFTTINIPKKNDNCIVCSKNAYINLHNYSKLDIYESRCIIKNNYDILSNDILSNNKIIYITPDQSINELYDKYINMNISDKLIFNCENKIRSKILVNKLRQNGLANTWCYTD